MWYFVCIVPFRIGSTSCWTWTLLHPFHDRHTYNGWVGEEWSLTVCGCGYGWTLLFAFLRGGMTGGGVSCKSKKGFDDIRIISRFPMVYMCVHLYPCTEYYLPQKLDCLFTIPTMCLYSCIAYLKGYFSYSDGWHVSRILVFFLFFFRRISLRLTLDLGSQRTTPPPVPSGSCLISFFLAKIEWSVRSFYIRKMIVLRILFLCGIYPFVNVGLIFLCSLPFCLCALLSPVVIVVFFFVLPASLLLRGMIARCFFVVAFLCVLSAFLPLGVVIVVS